MATNEELRDERNARRDHIDSLQFPLSAVAQEERQFVETCARMFYGEDWNYYSNALKQEVVWCFEKAIQHLGDRCSRPIRYLEIGSCQGLSMSIIGRLLFRYTGIRTLVSVDPYFPGGYSEGGRSLEGVPVAQPIDKTTRDKALALYRTLDLPVDLREKTSTSALEELIRNEARFDLVYIDGSHEGMVPLVDCGLCWPLLTSDGVLMLDDHYWPDVHPVKLQCDVHCHRIAECWKVAVYEKPRGEPRIAR